MSVQLVTRKGWGARTNRTGRPMGRVSRLIIHHAWRPDVPTDATAAYERQVMRSMEAFHAGKGWSAAPGYTLVFMPSGRVYVCTGFGRTGVHTVGYNRSAIAFQHCINGDAHDATSAAWQAMAYMADYAVARGYLAKGYKLNGHTDFSAKSCPGRVVYPRIGQVRTGATGGGGHPPDSKDDDMAGILRHGDGLGGKADGDVAEFQDSLKYCARYGPFDISPGWIGTGEDNDPLESDGRYGDRTAKAWQQMAKLIGYREHRNGRYAHPNAVARMRARTEAYVQAQLVVADARTSAAPE